MSLELDSVGSIADQIITDLSNLGYVCRCDTSRAVSVYTDRPNRYYLINQLIEQLPNSEYNPHAGSSSLGLIYYRGGSIRVRPFVNSRIPSGIENERILETNINYYASACAPIDVVFSGNNNVCFRVSNVYKAECVSTDTQNRKKGDILLYTKNGTVPISVKKRNSEYWESADSYYGANADAVIEYLLSKNNIQLLPTGKFRSDGVEKVKIYPEVAIIANKQQALDIVFGNDLFHNGGIVVKESFAQHHFLFTSNLLKISAEVVISTLTDVPSDLAVRILIRNDSTRNRPNSQYPGLRVLGAYASRTKNALLLSERQAQKILNKKQKGP